MILKSGTDSRMELCILNLYYCLPFKGTGLLSDMASDSSSYPSLQTLNIAKLKSVTHLDVSDLSEPSLMPKKASTACLGCLPIIRK